MFLPCIVIVIILPHESEIKLKNSEKQKKSPDVIGRFQALGGIQSREYVIT